MVMKDQPKTESVDISILILYVMEVWDDLGYEIHSTPRCLLYLHWDIFVSVYLLRCYTPGREQCLFEIFHFSDLNCENAEDMLQKSGKKGIW